jgi:hypothetical protein
MVKVAKKSTTTSILKGYLVPGHYYFSELEKRHYYSRILKFSITIFNFPQICHKIRMKTSRAQLQAYMKTYISLYLHSPLNDMRVPLVSIIFFLLSSSLSHLSFSTAGASHPLSHSVASGRRAASSERAGATRPHRRETELPA